MAMSFFVKTQPGDRVEANVTLPEQGGSSICGVVTGSGGEPAPGVLVLLLRDGEPFPLAQCVSDEHGLFGFGPLAEEQLYQLCVFPAGQRARRLDVQL